MSPNMPHPKLPNRAKDFQAAPPPPVELDAERSVLRAMREMRFGSIEVIFHQGRITEIRRIERQRFADRHQPEDS